MSYGVGVQGVSFRRVSVWEVYVLGVKVGGGGGGCHVRRGFVLSPIISV